ncbi:thiol-disulfide oxidoreductase DCC family protein [Neptunicella sp. SCSIO 80796]|uniref:thiol-disulfide oxidoreductase DCC family protein n=1 Tax=Neptunicella plasticusilytica TaxID=3117012 RepID=UPI003A4D454A
MKENRKTLPPHLEEDDKVILFDGVCKLCNAWSNFIIRHDKNHDFKLASVQSQEGKDILHYFNYPTDVYETMLVVNSAKCLEKSDAFFYVMKTLGFPWKLILIFTIIPKGVRNWLYDRVALNRYTLFGKYNYCSLPTPDHEKRYLNGNAITFKN